jgi:glyoxylase-like metal-dependent hydrolase (beta-lactamase superfamily II)
MLETTFFRLGPAITNSYLLTDTKTNEAVIIDPAWSGDFLAAEVERRGLQLGQVWVTHAHFDHIGGAAAIVQTLKPPPSLALHPADLPLWQARGGAPLFGLHMDLAPDPKVKLEHGQLLSLGSYTFEVRHVPGHTPGHVMFYCAAEKSAFVGDVIFAGSIGRTDLPGGDYAALMNSIRSQILTLPNDTLLYSGHGDVTSVGAELDSNPFLT